MQKKSKTTIPVRKSNQDWSSFFEHSVILFRYIHVHHKPGKNRVERGGGGEKLKKKSNVIAKFSKFRFCLESHSPFDSPSRKNKCFEQSLVKNVMWLWRYEIIYVNITYIFIFSLFHYHLTVPRWTKFSFIWINLNHLHFRDTYLKGQYLV